MIDVVVRGRRRLRSMFRAGVTDRLIGRGPAVGALAVYAACLASVLISIGVSYHASAPYWSGVAFAYVFYGLACAASLIPRPADYSPWNAAVVIVLVLAAHGALWGAVACDRTAAIMPYSPAFLTSNVAFVILIFRGRLGTAWTGIVGCVALGALIGPHVGSPEWGQVAFPGFTILLLAVLTATSIGLWPMLGELDALRLRRARVTDAQWSARSVEARRRERIGRIDRLVRPLLTRMADGAVLTDDDVTAARLTEARLRDGIRAVALDTDRIREAAWRARGRGVSVTLLDDGGLDRFPPGRRADIVEALEDLIERELEQVDADGELVARVSPHGRRPVASVTVVGVDGVHRSECDADGRIDREIRL
ncbi:hypothetical protein [Gordonia shandongensis]|uniref:hypothetical protein n=1 Tax=Gordonia shandongensis TaxID=376351 RepID=UPI00040087AF|nr:hypothetical protein [Gordonia shandongensis]